VRNFALVPYRTIAVDPNVLPYGSVIYVPAARGAAMVLPTGETFSHDGYFFAGDTGGAIKRNHIDVFCGEMPSNCFPSFIGSSDNKRFRASIVTDAAIVSALQSLHEAQ
jgi:3D (Asp-Asp-Asp) domain-containing protein